VNLTCLGGWVTDRQHRGGGGCAVGGGGGGVSLPLLPPSRRPGRCAHYHSAQLRGAGCYTCSASTSEQVLAGTFTAAAAASCQT
jgi:hypothetical protein